MSYYMLCLLPEPLAVAFGDPHMITLDGVEYTFNGYGEYHILQIAGPGFNLQGRMQPLIDEYGNVSRATVYTAFAMKETNSDVVQVNTSMTFVIVESKIYKSHAQFKVNIYGGQLFTLFAMLQAKPEKVKKQSVKKSDTPYLVIRVDI